MTQKVREILILPSLEREGKGKNGENDWVITKVVYWITPVILLPSVYVHFYTKVGYSS